MSQEFLIEQAYRLAKEYYGELGIDTDEVIHRLTSIPLSLPCWQGDDVGGFEQGGEALSVGGIQVTGNYPGKARSIDELRIDLEKALSLIPGNHRVSLHAMYLDNQGAFIERNEIQPEHFRSWIDWAKQQGLGLDFNPTYFSHSKAADGFTLSHVDRGIRQFWIEHGIACRKISEQMGRQLGTACVTNFWIPDGYKDIPADRYGPRQRLVESLDAIFAESIDPAYHLDAVEGKLFGIGSESYVVGSYEFYMGYALSRRKLLCLDMGHFHPTESVADKISSVLSFLDRILLHISRNVRWDSDHVVIWDDELDRMAEEMVWNGFLDGIHIGMDFFDATIHRVAGWVIGARSVLKALMHAMLAPAPQLRKLEAKGDYTGRLAMRERIKSIPLGAVWDYYCVNCGVPTEGQWLAIVQQYERDVTSKR